MNRDTLLDSIADAIDREPTGSITVRWSTEDGRRRVEVARSSDWSSSTMPVDPTPTGESTPPIDLFGLRPGVAPTRLAEARLGAAMALVATRPEISGAEIGRALGVTERHGSRLRGDAKAILADTDLTSDNTEATGE